jgi:hypothetical protein
MMDALGVSSHPCCDDVMASIDDQKSARRALSAFACKIGRHHIYVLELIWTDESVIVDASNGRDDWLVIRAQHSMRPLT